MTKAAGIKSLKGILPSMGKSKIKNIGMPTVPGSKPLITPEMPAEARRMSDNVPKPVSKIKPAAESLDYSKINAMPTKIPEAEAGTVEYGSKGVKGYKKPPKPPAPV
jgi:hypothetical protein